MPVSRSEAAGQTKGGLPLHRVLVIIGAAALLALLTTGQISGGNLVLKGVTANQTPGINPPDPRFGVIESFESPADADGLNVGWTRIIFHWARAQAEGPDSWTPKISDEQIEADIAAGREVVGLLIGIPDWARDENKLPKGLWLDHDDVDNTWANYVRNVVTRYQGRITHWIIWNEPDIRETEIAHTWDGSVADFAQLLRVAYLVAKESNPDAVVHLSAFSYWADVFGNTEQYMARLLDEIMADPQAADHNYYFDAATAHLYFQPVQVYDLLDFFLSVMRQRGLNHPIWLAETNAPPRDDPEWPVPDWFLSVTLEEQAAFVPQALSSAIAAGADRIAVYKLRDNEEDRLANPEPFGLVRLEGTHRPAYDTFRVAIEQLSSTVGGERERWDVVGQIQMDQPGKSTTVLFSRLPSQQSAQVEAIYDAALLVDMWGESQPISPEEDGFFHIELPGALCSQTIGDYCMIGGPTYYLVQVEPATPTASLTPSAPTPEATDTSSPTPMPTATTPPATATFTPIPTETPTLSPPEPTSTPEVSASPRATTTDIADPDSPAETTSNLAAPGLWFLGGAILVAAMLILFWIAQRRNRGA
jgi:hypothetical protein